MTDTETRKKIASDFIELSQKVKALSNVLHQEQENTTNGDAINFLWNSLDTLTELAVLRQKAIEALDHSTPPSLQNRQYLLETAIKEIASKFNKVFSDLS